MLPFRLPRRRVSHDQQLEKELRFHLEEEERNLIARGYSPAEARRQARLTFGGPEQIKEECRDARGARWLEEFLQDVGYLLRTSRQKPGFALITLLILALGIGATTAMFAVVNSVLLRPLSFPQPQRIVVLHGVNKDLGEFWGLSYPEFRDLEHDARSLTLSGWTFGSSTITSPGAPEHVESRQISAGLFPVLGIQPALGRGFRADEDRPGASPVIILSYALWQRRFASDPTVLGKPLVYGDKTYAIVGVAPPNLQLSGQSDLFTPLAQANDPRFHNRQARFVQVVGRLASGVTLEQAQSELSLIAHQFAVQYPEANAGLGMRIHPLLEDRVGNIRGTLWLLLAAIGLVLLIACVNIASLFLTRAVSRERELAMRAALGAGRARLVRQCLTETAVLGFVGGLLGIVVAALCLRPFVMLWPDNLPRAAEIHLDARALCFALGVSLLCGFLFGLTPALRIPFERLEQVLRAGGRSVGSASRPQHMAFVIAEIALAFVLLISAGMLGQTLVTLSSLNPGFRPDHVLAAGFSISPKALNTPAEIRAAWQRALLSAQRTPGVESAALSDIIPMRDGENVGPYRATPNPLPPDQEPVALASSITPDFHKVMGIPLLSGRFFNDHDRADSQPVVIVDENLALHAFGRKDVVGQHLWLFVSGSAPSEIVGVVGHVRHWGLPGDDRSPVHDQLYYPLSQVPDRFMHFYSSVMSIAVRTRTPPLEMVTPLQSALRGVAQDQTLYDVHDMEQLVAASLARQRFLSLLFGIFAGLALLLASIGIYGVLAYLTGQRTSEIGVRMAVGANVRDILRLILSQGLKMIVAGIGLGLVAALVAAKVFEHLVPGMQPLSFATFALMVPLLTFAALFASFLPARRASLLDPLKALRQE